MANEQEFAKEFKRNMSVSDEVTMALLLTLCYGWLASGSFADVV